MKKFNRHQQLQEQQYRLPYHYSDLFSSEDKLLWEVNRVSLLGQIKKLLQITPGQSVLDVGCGDGRICYELKNERVSLIGIDHSKNAINFARAFNPQGKFIEGDLETINLKNKFDRILLIETLEHIEPQKINQVLSNLKEQLKKTGMMIISVPSNNLPLIDQPKHYQHFSKETLEGILYPHFQSVEIIGYANLTYKRKIFNFLRLIAYIFYPFRNRLYLVRLFYKFIQSYYNSQLALGNPNSCLGLIAICKNPKHKKL